MDLYGKLFKALFRHVDDWPFFLQRSFDSDELLSRDDASMSLEEVGCEKHVEDARLIRHREKGHSRFCALEAA